MVWTRIANIAAVVVSKYEGKPIIPQETITLVALDNRQEAYYLAGMVNSAPFQFAAISYSQAGGKSMGSPHVLENINIPKFNSKSKPHLRLAELSEKAHKAAKENDEKALSQIETEIDEVAATIWGLIKEELKEIRASLEELR